MSGAGQSDSNDPVGSRSQGTLVREVNERIRELAGTNGTQAWEFLCECGDSDCHRFLTLTLHEYDGLRGAVAATAILAHAPGLHSTRTDNRRGGSPA